jgi:uncharacterized protein YdeI (YjbR/CyaY-like superfamily)
MGKRDPRIDDYIAKAAEYAKPILTHLRELIHAGCLDVEETVKWRNPSFMYKGLLCGIAAFKQYCVIGFWKDAILFDRKNPNAKPCAIPDRITNVGELPSDKVMLAYIKEAARLNAQGVKVPKAKSKPKKDLVVPSDLVSALKKNKKAQSTFEQFSYSHKKEYAEWITQAKREETRTQRLATAVAWIAEGKARNWKYDRC